MAREGANRSMRMTVALDPLLLADIKEAAAEVGVSASAWAALRLGEAVRAQRNVGKVLDSFGLNLAQLMLESGVKDGEADGD